MQVDFTRPARGRARLIWSTGLVLALLLSGVAGWTGEMDLGDPLDWRTRAAIESMDQFQEGRSEYKAGELSVIEFYAGQGREVLCVFVRHVQVLSCTPVGHMWREAETR